MLIGKIILPTAALLLSILVASIPSSYGFAPSTSTTTAKTCETHHHELSSISIPRPLHVPSSSASSILSTQRPNNIHASPTALSMTNPLTLASKTIVTPLASLFAGQHGPLLKRVLVLLLAASLLLTKSYQRILWPGSLTRDPTVSEPLPPTALGCPLFGQPNLFGGTPKDGPFAAMKAISRKLGSPSIFRMYTFGMPVTAVSGLDNVKTTLKREFEDDGINTMLYGDNWSELFGGESILYEGDKKKHSLLRRLVGGAMSPEAIRAAVPAIQAVAERQVDTAILGKAGDVVKMEDVVTDYTLSIAHRQILGLDLEDGEEVDEFHRQTKQWMRSMSDPVLFTPFRLPWLKWTKGYKAHDYLVGKVEEKLARLDKDGPDDSTLSKIYFAEDEESEEGGTARKLTHQQVIDNALILIIAGTETSSSTLTMASLLLGLHPNVWEKIKAEQSDLRAKYGDSLTKEQLDECTYLDAVIKETMRIRPIDSIETRKTKETLVVDGKQIPKNSIILANVRQSHEQDRVTFKEDGSHMDLKEGFHPDRWLDSATKPSVFMGFGEGGRRCLGERLAMTEMKVFLATMARRVDFDLVRSADEEILYNKNAFMSRPIDGTEITPRAASSVAKVEA